MRIARVPIALLPCISALSCAGAAKPANTTDHPAARQSPPALQLVESWPVETSLDHPDIPDAHEVWIEMIDSAERTIDIEQFYGSNGENSRLEPVLAALERAAARGVVIRSVFGKAFYPDTYSQVPDRLGALPGAELRILDMRALTGGVQHAKFFVVDDREAYIGSQNFDWRSLAHIQELGVRIRQPQLVAAVAAVFAMDWQLAAVGESARAEAQRAGTELTDRFPVTVEYRGKPVEVRPGMSPTGWLPAEPLWDLPALLAMIDSAETRVRVQLLSYSLENHDGSQYRGLDDALRRAAARGVAVELLLSDWNKRPKSIAALQALQRLPKITVKLVEIPEHSGGFIPFARVIHAKLVTVDGARSWLGTSNFSGDYFHHSRNLALLVDGASFAADLDLFFESVWASEYAHVVDPEREYQPPRIAQ